MSHVTLSDCFCRDVEHGRYDFTVVEDQEGRFSGGKVISIRTDPPAIAELRLYPQEASLRVGERVWFSTVGITDSGEQRLVVCNWTLSGNIGSLDHQELAGSVEFTAEAPGQGSITATWKDRLSVTATIQVTSAQ